MKPHYFETWHRYERQPVAPLTPDEARARDQAGENYVAVLGEVEHPDCFIEVRGGFYGVSFLDEEQREYLMYAFEESEPSKLFLKEAIFREYQRGAVKPSRATAYRFALDGAVSIESGSEPFKEVHVQERRIDVSGNWGQKPSFGDYTDIIRKERLPATA